MKIDLGRVAASLLLLVGCEAPAPRDATWERHAMALAGNWSVNFSYSPDPLSGEREARSASGSIALVANRTMNTAIPGGGVPTNYGTYDVAFPALGGSPSGSEVPALVVAVQGADSVLTVIETNRQGFSMQMNGRLRGDSISGRWEARQRQGVIASGSFVMIRR